MHHVAILGISALAIDLPAAGTGPRTIFHFLRYEHTSIPCRFKSQMLKETLITRSTCSGSHEALLWLANTVYAKTPKKAPRNHTVSGDGTINMQTETRTSFGFIT